MILRRTEQLIELLILFLSRIFPRSKDLAIYGSWTGERFGDNSGYLFLYALQHAKGKHVWIAKDKRIVKSMRLRGLPAYYAYSLSGIYFQLRARIVFVNTGAADVCKNLIGGATLVNLWHGVPLKKIMYDVHRPGVEERTRLSATENFVICTSENMRGIYKSAFLVDDDHCLALGQPRNDFFFVGGRTFKSLTVIPSDLSKRISGKKIILYAPTHRLEGKQKLDLNSIINFSQLNRQMENEGSVFVIKKHFYHRNENPTEGYSSIIDLTRTNIDTQALLKLADVLVTDYSSIYIDYLLRGKPVIFFEFDLDHYQMVDREMYFEYDKVTPGAKVKTNRELLKALSYAIKGEYDNTEEKKICDFFYIPNLYRDELSSNRILKHFGLL